MSSKIYRLTFLPAWGFIVKLTSRNGLEINIYIGYILAKYYQFSTSSFFLAWAIQKSATTASSRQQEIDMMCLCIEYYRYT